MCHHKKKREFLAEREHKESHLCIKAVKRRKRRRCDDDKHTSQWRERWIAKGSQRLLWKPHNQSVAWGIDIIHMNDVYMLPVTFF